MSRRRVARIYNAGMMLLAPPLAALIAWAILSSDQRLHLFGIFSVGTVALIVGVIEFILADEVASLLRESSGFWAWINRLFGQPESITRRSVARSAKWSFIVSVMFLGLGFYELLT